MGEEGGEEKREGGANVHTHMHTVGPQMGGLGSACICRVDVVQHRGWS